MKAPHEGAPIIIDQPSSYLAVSELVVRALDGKMFSEDSVNWQQYVANLPQSAAVSETPTPSSSSIRASLMSS